MTDHTPRLRAALTLGLTWLHHTPQPNGAVISHHGMQLTEPDADRRLTFIPHGWNNHAVIVLAVLNPTHDPQRPYDPPTNPLAPDELDTTTHLLTTLGATVVHTWNGHPHTTGSLALAEPAHPTLTAAVARYHDGCPTHPEHHVFCHCGWYTTGNTLIVAPTGALT